MLPSCAPSEDPAVSLPCFYLLCRQPQQGSHHEQTEQDPRLPSPTPCLKTHATQPTLGSRCRQGRLQPTPGFFVPRLRALASSGQPGTRGPCQIQEEGELGARTSFVISSKRGSGSESSTPSLHSCSCRSPSLGGMGAPWYSRFARFGFARCSGSRSSSSSASAGAPAKGDGAASCGAAAAALLPAGGVGSGATAWRAAGCARAGCAGTGAEGGAAVGAAEFALTPFVCTVFAALPSATANPAFAEHRC